MPRLPRRTPLLAGVVFVALAAVRLQAAAPSELPVPGAAPTLQIDALGKGTVPLDGSWQFHIGDNPSWALPQTGDATGSNGWEQLSPDKTWGTQGHPAYTGYAWYRKHIHLAPAPSASPDFALLIRRVDDAYEIYWNGQLVGHKGNLPPHPSNPYVAPAQTFGLGPVRDGVLALRVWKAPLQSSDTGQLGGLSFAPIIGSPTAIAANKTEQDYTWLRSRQYFFGMQSIYGLVMVLGLLVWLRNRSQHLLLWIAVFSGTPLATMILVGLRLPFSYNFAIGWLQPIHSLREGGHFSLYTDGLLEARNSSGAIFSFARLDALFSSRPNAAEATEAAVDSGRDDDITVLTLTRLASGTKSTTELSTPIFAPA